MKKNSKPLVYTVVTVLGLSTFMMGCTNDQAARNVNDRNVGMGSPNYQTTYPNTGYVGNPDSPNYNPNQYRGYVGDTRTPNYNLNQYTGYVGSNRNPKYNPNQYTGYVGNTNNLNDNYQNNISKKSAGLNNTIRSKCNQLKGVKDCSVAVQGDTCVVAVDPNTTLNESLKNQIESACKNTDANIDKVVISQDNNVYDQLRRLGQNVGAGQPIKDINTEIQNIFNRLAPRR
ncbi:YhcN/YlaJ family sporulation lipoprotein [Tepidibacter hydrothermalis]|uniref:YhcN/YlaJ family sporulation lipoprotein n=1 Tax=Tepidibacter hydrothermalis TaxID=3036126 RepID=A0ABY8E7G9_9FIRM|nr:YhcN/YlaJ family sporulation lipoprotein [Tepidibacter hydrothermalis]WFD08799.1 YhcN/YlaJ family sporulation lipoprotein [Tepidibacter hydrothermalis]